MLKLSSQQLSAMDQQADEEFVQVVTKVVREEFSHEVSHLNDEALDVAVRRTIREAKIAGLTMEEDILLYVAGAVKLSPRTIAEMPELLDILANDGVSYEDRSAALSRVIVEGRP